VAARRPNVDSLAVVARWQSTPGAVAMGGVSSGNQERTVVLSALTILATFLMKPLKLSNP